MIFFEIKIETLIIQNKSKHEIEYIFVMLS